MSKEFVNKIIAEIIANGATDKVYKKARAQTDTQGMHKVTLYKSDLKSYTEVIDIEKTFNKILAEVRQAFPNSYNADQFKITVTMEKRYTTQFRKIVSEVITGDALDTSTHFAHQGETTVGVYALAKSQSLTKKETLDFVKKLDLKVTYDKRAAAVAFQNAVFNTLNSINWSWDSKESSSALKYFKTLTITGKLTHRTQNVSGSEDFDLGQLKLNVLYKEFEKEFLKASRKSTAISKLATHSASPSPIDKLESKIVHALADKIPNAKKTGLPPKYKDTKSSGKVTRKKKSKKPVIAPGLDVSMNKPEKRAPTLNLASLIPILNQRLPAAIAANMGTPALNYRTGRFASSVRVTDINITAKGHPSIGFTYMRSPYEVFEFPGGNHLATPDRDPRKLISRSIREVAVGLIDQRFFTRRT